jgi:hypothetical protein
VALPFAWLSDAERRHYFATAKTIPYQRTGELFRAFDVLSDRRELSTRIVNMSDYAHKVLGEQQHPGHAKTGWRKLSSYEPEALKGAIPVASRALESEVFRFLTKKGLL